MEKRVMGKMTRLPNVAGRVDYISNPKRQENLLGFYQTPEDAHSFWKALAQESQELSKYNKAQMEKHNREEQKRFEAGEIKHRKLLKTVEARELMICLPNDLCGKLDDRAVAKYIARDYKTRFGIECAVGVHQNKTRTNYHIHIILSERKMLGMVKASIATRNTYYDENGTRSNKKDCVDVHGNLKSGCRLVRKGEKLYQRAFAEKDPLFANKAFTYTEKERFAKLFNQMSKDHWVVYNHYTNPHIRYYSIKRGEPAGLTSWKQRENDYRRDYNESIDRLLISGDLTPEQAIKLKFEYLRRSRELKEERKAARELWVEQWERYNDRRKAEYEYMNIIRDKSTFVLLCELILLMSGVDMVKVRTGVERTVSPERIIKVYPDKRVQKMIDDMYIAAGEKTPSELALLRKAEKLTHQQDGDLSLLIGAAEENKEKYKKQNEQKSLDAPTEHNGR